MSDVSKLEKQRDDAKILLARREQALRLSNHPDFKDLILDEFCVKECARYAQNSANPALSEIEQKDCLAIAQSAGHLRRFLSVVITMGNNAEDNMEGLEQAIHDARQESGE